MPRSSRRAEPSSACRHWSRSNKIDAVQALGADVRIVGRSQDDAQQEVERLVDRGRPDRDPAVRRCCRHCRPGHASDLEIIEDCPNVELVLVPLSGGGLASGVAAAIKGRLPRTRVIGVSMARGAAMHASLARGTAGCRRRAGNLADSLGGGIGLEQPLHLRHVSRPAR